METLLLGLGGNIWNQNRIIGKIEVKGKVDGRIVNRNGESNIGGSIIGGTLTVFNDFRKDESATNSYHTIREMGKTAKGVHIENNNEGKFHLNAWYFNKEDYATNEKRKTIPCL